MDNRLNSFKIMMLGYCMDKLSCEKSETALVGDSIYDAVAAKEAGIDFVAVTYGFGFKTKQEAQDCGSCYVCESVRELSEYLMR